MNRSRLAPVQVVSLVLPAGAAIVGAWHGRMALVAAAVLTFLAVPLVQRVTERRWRLGLGLRGVGIGFICAHLPVLVMLIRATDRSHCIEGVCLHALRLGALGVPVGFLLGAIGYWCFAPDPPPPPRAGVSPRDLRP